MYSVSRRFFLKKFHSFMEHWCIHTSMNILFDIINSFVVFAALTETYSMLNN